MSVTRIWNADDNKWELVGGTVAGVQTGQAFLPLGGGTMTGPLTLSGPPVSSLHAATKAYVDSLVGAAPAWSAITGKPSTFPPSTHTHPGSDLSSDVPISRVPTGTSSTTVSLGNHNHSGVYEALGHGHGEYAANTALLAHQGTSSQILVSGSGPSGGQNGDIWLQII